MLAELRCSPISEKMPVIDGTQAINVQSLGRLVHQGSRSSPKLQKTQVFFHGSVDSEAITVPGTNTELQAHRRSRRQCALQDVMLWSL